MRKFFLTACAVTGFIASKAQQNNNNNNTSAVQAYITQYKDVAIKEMVRTGVPASITLAQGILESASGNSKLAKYSNNHFGIKCKTEWSGATVYQDDDIRNECFRVYQTAEDSYKDHSDFLKNRPYYTALFDLDPTDYKSWAKGLKSSGYATEQDYAKNLISLIERYDLEQYSDQGLAMMNGQARPEDRMAYSNRAYNNVRDNTAAATMPKNSGNGQVALFNDDDNMAVTISGNNTPSKSVTYTSQAITNAVSGESSLKSNSYPSGIFRINQTAVLYAKKGASLFAIATSKGIDYGKLVAYNDLPEGTDILSKDRLVYLSRKPKKCDKPTHTVQSGENLDEIAQKEGIQLYYLAQLNHIQTTAAPLAGENLYLRDVAPNAPKLASNNTYAVN